MDASVIAAIIGAFATIIGAITASIAQRQVERRRSDVEGRARSVRERAAELAQEFDLEGEQNLHDLREAPPRGQSIMHATVEARLREAQTALENQRATEKASRWSSRALLGGQFVVGGLLASAFVQQTLSAPLIGFLGLIVLLSQIIRERFNPEAISNAAKQKISQLNTLIRRTEDDLALYDAYQSGFTTDDGDEPSLHEILKTLSDGLSEVVDS